MGFSLEGMFNNFDQIINNNSLDEQDRLAKLESEIKWWKEYAIQCSQLKEED